MTHDYTRPDWNCGCCGREWPCSPAKVERAERFPDPTALRQHMIGLMEAATTELPLDGWRPDQLRARFVGWIPRAGRP